MVSQSSGRRSRGSAIKEKIAAGPKGRKTDTAVLTRNWGWGERDGQSRLRGQGRRRETETSAAVTHQACLGQGGGDEQRHLGGLQRNSVVVFGEGQGVSTVEVGT